MMPKFQIWYLKPEHLRTTLQGLNGLDPKRLKRTHAFLVELEFPEDDYPSLEEIYTKMQGEVWSPNGEARSLIQSLSLDHTSMSIDDIIVDGEGRVFIVESIGFKEF